MTIPTTVSEMSVFTLAYNAEVPHPPISLTTAQGALYFENNADLVVYYTALNGAVTLLALGVHYTIAGDGILGAAQLSPIFNFAEANGVLHISRSTPLVQQATYDENDGFPAKVTERVLDRDAIIDQDIMREISRTLRIPRYEAAVPIMLGKATRAGKLMRWNAAGDAIEFVDSTVGLGIYRVKQLLTRLVPANIVIPILALNPDQLAAPTADVIQDTIVRLTIAHRTYPDAQTHDQIGTYECLPSRKGATGNAYANARLVSFFGDPALYDFGFDPTALVDAGAFTITSSTGTLMDQLNIVITPGTNWSAGGPAYNGGNTFIFVTAER